MSSVNDILSTARSALLAQQAGMDVTGSNIANAQNPNYSRRLLNMAAASTVQLGGNYIGTGVELETIQRGRDQIIDLGIWREQASFGYFESNNKYASFVESVFNDIGGIGLSQSLDEFWNSWLELSNHPEDPGARSNVVAKARQLANKFNNMDTQMRSIATQSQRELEGQVEDFNQILNNLARINEQLGRSGYKSGGNNSLLDKRDSLIGELSSFLDLQVVFNEGGTVTLFGSNKVLLNKNRAFELELKNRTTDGQLDVYLSLYGGDEFAPKGGSLKSILEQSNQTNEMKELDILAKNVVEEINNLHKTFYDLNGNTGNDFFEAAGITSGTIKLRSEIANNISNIAISKDREKGDGSGSLDIAKLHSKRIADNNNLTIDDSYRKIISLVGQKAKESVDNFETQSEVVTALKNQRQAIMGVSLEEEMINLIKYQNAFASAGRVISALDEMYQTIINLV